MSNVDLSKALQNVEETKEKDTKKKGAKKGRLPTPDVPEGKTQFDEVLDINPRTHSMPAESKFYDPKNFWESRKKYFQNFVAVCDEELAKMSDDVEERRATRIAKQEAKTAERALRSEAVRKQVAKDPSILAGLAGTMSAEQIAALLEQLNSIAAQKAVE